MFWHQKILPKNWQILLENSDFWQYLPNLAPSGNPGNNCIRICYLGTDSRKAKQGTQVMSITTNAHDTTLIRR